MRNDLNHSLGLLLTVNSPFFDDYEFLPEVTILRGLAYFTLCEYSDVDRILLEYESRYQPMRAELKAFLARYASPEKQKLADQAYEEYFDGRRCDKQGDYRVHAAVLQLRRG